jgi:hypothetical protein
MNKTWFLLPALAFGMAWGVLTYGCGSSAIPAQPVLSSVPTPVCGSPSAHGMTSVGSTLTSFPSNAVVTANPITFGSDETATSISLYISGTATGQVRFGIYNSASSNPTVLVTQTDPQNLVSNGWTTANLKNVLLPAGAYWVFFQMSNANTVALQSSTGANTFYQYPLAWSEFPTSYPSLSNTSGFTNTNLSYYLSTCP